jgi:molybdopterin synthase catalytic subunit
VGRDGVDRLEYEAYEEQVVPRLAAIAAQMRVRWPDLGRVALLHRVGVVPIGESSVVVAVSSPHRSAAFEAARFGIDTLKATAPIWKRERWADGESCHGPGQAHVELLRKGSPAAARQAIGNPKRLAASDLMRFCGECHRPPASESVAIDWSDPWNVRHQPLYLTESACFKNSPGGLTCMQCHDPHSPLRSNDAAYYNARCGSCHSAASHPPAEVCRAEPGCASCHMPAVRPQPELAFHNHWIGVYQAGNPLQPQR